MLSFLFCVLQRIAHTRQKYVMAILQALWITICYRFKLCLYTYINIPRVALSIQWLGHRLDNKSIKAQFQAVSYVSRPHQLPTQQVPGWSKLAKAWSWPPALICCQGEQWVELPPYLLSWTILHSYQVHQNSFNSTWDNLPWWGDYPKAGSSAYYQK